VLGILFFTSLRTSPEALLRLIRHRWSIKNGWPWARYANGVGAPMFAFYRSVAMNLLGEPATAWFARPARAGLRHPRPLSLGGVVTTTSAT
jgi:hypothetical protein